MLEMNKYHCWKTKLPNFIANAIMSACLDVFHPNQITIDLF